MSQFTPRKIAALLATAGIALSMVGVGLSASFTDTGVVSQSVTVGTFAIELSTSVDGATLSNNNRSITFTAAAIQASAPGSIAMPFTVKNIGSIPLALTISHSMTGNPSERFAAIPLNGAENALAPGASLTFAGGLNWSELVNDDLGRVINVTYTISAQA